MNSDCLKEALRRWTLVLGVTQILVGCLVGLIPPTAVPWFRGIVMAHLEFTANGVLMVVFGLLVRELHLGTAMLKAWFATLQIGAWFNGGAGLIAAFTGVSSPLMTTLNSKFPPPHGSDSLLVTVTLMICGVMILAALVLTLIGLLRAPARPSP